MKKSIRYAKLVKEESTHVLTENGAKAKNTSSDALVDLFATIGALRGDDKELSETKISRLHVLIDEAAKEDKLLVAKIIFYCRDIREGLGERDIFKEALNYAATKYPEIVKDNIQYIGTFGRFDDLYALIGTPLEDDMWAHMKIVFEQDLISLKKGESVSLLAKWIKSADASSRNTRILGILTANKLGYSVFEFKRLVKSLRREINIVEAKMSANEWDDVNYAQVPSRAMLTHRKAFSRHDADGFTSYLDSVSKGEATMNATGIYPYDIVEKVFRGESNAVLEEMWKALPDFVGKDVNALAVVDTSGSMTNNGPRPLATSLGLGMYFAEKNQGAFHNLFMTFSDNPEFVEIKGDSLTDKIRNMKRANWDNNTNLEAAFDEILRLAVDNKIKPYEMIKSLIIISDMEIDRCEHSSWSFYDDMAAKFQAAGYEIPNVVFWNVNSRQDLFHADNKRKGVQLVSGQAVATFKNVINSTGMNPYDAMLEALNRERYECITLASEKSLEDIDLD